MGTALTGIFNNGVAGMMAFSEGMGAVSDNIANQSTVGYKRVETLFSTVLGQVDRTLNNGSSTSSVLQARNVAGVKPITRQLVDVQGAIQTTNRSLDMAIRGQGMFMFAPGTIEGGTLVYDAADIVYSRAGDLTAFVPLTDDGTGILTGATETFLANKNGQFLLAQPFTAADLLAGATDPTGALEAVQTSSQAAFAGLPTTTAALAAVIPAAGATTVSTPIFYVDSAGDQQGLTVEFSNPVVVAGTSTTWDTTVYDSTGAVVSTQLGFPTFDNVGQLPAGSTLSVTAGGTTFTIDIEDVTMLGNSPGGTSVQAIQTSYSHDGLEAGAFEGLEFREDGLIFGRYTGGAIQPLYRIPLASFSNPNALESLAGNVYGLTPEAGEPTLRFPGDDFSALVLNAVETSNVEIADAFSQMIIVQRAYGSAAKIVQTADEMSTVVRDLMR